MNEKKLLRSARRLFSGPVIGQDERPAAVDSASGPSNAKIVAARYFIDKDMSAGKSVDPDACDSHVVWEVRTLDDGSQEAVHTFFDFSRSISDRRVKNRIHRRIIRKDSFEGLISIILRKFRETDEDEFSRIVIRLRGKSDYMKKVKRRKQVVETRYEPFSKLPG